jgi:FkbH-like protein
LGLLPRDIAIKNYGVEANRKAILYDFDDIELLADSNPRPIPQGDIYDEMRDLDDWVSIKPGDFFPEQWNLLLGSPEILEVEGLVEHFRSAHKDLYDPVFWSKMKEVAEWGEILELYPYPMERRLTTGGNDSGVEELDHSQGDHTASSPVGDDPVIAQIQEERHRLEEATEKYRLLYISENEKQMRDITEEFRRVLDETQAMFGADHQKWLKTLQFLRVIVDQRDRKNVDPLPVLKRGIQTLLRELPKGTDITEFYPLFSNDQYINDITYGIEKINSDTCEVFCDILNAIENMIVWGQYHMDAGQLVASAMQVVAYLGLTKPQEVEEEIKNINTAVIKIRYDEITEEELVLFLPNIAKRLKDKALFRQALNIELKSTRALATGFKIFGFVRYNKITKDIESTARSVVDAITHTAFSMYSQLLTDDERLRNFMERFNQELQDSPPPRSIRSSEDFLRFIEEKIKAYGIADKPKQGIKVIVLDADGVLWGGIVDEDGVGGIKIGDDDQGLPFKRFQQELKKLAQQGILLAINSKNDLANIVGDENQRGALDHDNMVLRREDFVVIKANWDDKEKNMRAIAAELRLGLDSFLFLDDTPVERDRMRTMLPEVNTPELPKDPKEYVPFLQELNVLAGRESTKEDAVRTKLYEQVRLAEELRQKSATEAEYFYSLEMRAIIRVGKENKPHVTRIAQLFERTNQVHTMTIRYSKEEIQGFIDDPAYEVFTLESVSKFGNEGIVAAAVVYETSKGEWVIQNLCMSCRVINRTMEDAFIAEIAQYLKRHKATDLIGYYNPRYTEGNHRNQLAEKVYEKMGFQKIMAQSSDYPQRIRLEHDLKFTEQTRAWEFDLNKGSLETPRWIRVLGAAWAPTFVYEGQREKLEQASPEDIALAKKSAQIIMAGYHEYYRTFNGVSGRAEERDENLDWVGAYDDNKERDRAHKKFVTQTYDRVQEVLGDHMIDLVMWELVRSKFVQLLRGQYDVDLRIIFFDSVMRMVFFERGIPVQYEHDIMALMDLKSYGREVTRRYRIPQREPIRKIAARIIKDFHSKGKFEDSGQAGQVHFERTRDDDDHGCGSCQPCILARKRILHHRPDHYSESGDPDCRGLPEYGQGKKDRRRFIRSQRDRSDYPGFHGC